jgi:hypothetical protein
MNVLIPDDRKSITGINIGTSSPLETIWNYDKPVDYVYLNIYTVIRNYIQLMDGNTKDKIKFLNNPNNLVRLAKAINDEMMIIESLFPIDKEIVVKFYLLNYKLISKPYPNVRNIDDFSGLKYHILKVQKPIVNLLVRNHHRTFPNVILNRANTFVITHYPIDLVSLAYGGVKLVESFTGEMKDYKKWYTKFHKLGKKDMSVFPFNKYTYAVLGDEWFLKPESIKFREEFYKIALKHNWNPYTRAAKVKSDIRKHKDVYDYLKTNYPRIFGVYGI